MFNTLLQMSAFGNVMFADPNTLVLQDPYKSEIAILNINLHKKVFFCKC